MIESEKEVKKQQITSKLRALIKVNFYMPKHKIEPLNVSMWKGKAPVSVLTIEYYLYSQKKMLNGRQLNLAQCRKKNYTTNE